MRGVHIVGETAEELIHIGQACMHFGGTIEYFLRTVFNFPTLAALYKAAAYDVLVRLGPERDRLALGEASPYPGARSGAGPASAGGRSPRPSGAPPAARRRARRARGDFPPPAGG